MPDVELSIAGRSYRVACRPGEEQTLHAAAALVDGKSREAIAGFGALSESRQLLFASLLLADQILDKSPDTNKPALAVAALPPVAAPAPIDPALAERVTRLAQRLEQLAATLEK